MFYERLKELCKNRGTSVTAMAKALNLSSGNVTNWKHGRKPKVYIALKIAEFLNVSVEYLMCEDSAKENPSVINKNNPTANSDEALMFALWGGDNADITPQMLDKVREFARFVREEERRKANDTDKPI